MGKKNSSAPVEDHLLVSEPPSTATIIDTHAHFVLTFETYCQKYKDGKYLDAFDFFKVMYEEKNVAAVVDVWCVPPVREAWKEYADAGLDKEKWGGLEYWFVMGMLIPFFSVMCFSLIVKLFSGVHPWVLFAPQH